MDDRNEKVSDSVERDIQGAVKWVRMPREPPKTLGKAAAHAAAGDVAGAAAEVVKDPETLKKILLILLIPVISFVLITTMFLYALPISIYEGVSTYFSDIEEQWESDVYGSDKKHLCGRSRGNAKGRRKIVWRRAVPYRRRCFRLVPQYLEWLTILVHKR